MIVTECWGWDEMGLTQGGGAGQDVTSTDIEIVESDHFLAAGLSGTVPVLTDIASTLGTARFGNGIAGDQATVIARATLADGQAYDVVYIYEKGAELPVAPADGSGQTAADIRICLGFDERSFPVWNDNGFALLAAAIKYTLGLTPQARNPSPHDGALHEETWASLGWSPGDFAASHDVYVSDSYEDVNDGTGEAFRGNQQETSFIIGFPGFPYPDGLVPGTTYYWRIDGVNEPDPNSPWRGSIWSFSIPPKTAYAPDPADGAEFVDPNADLSWTAGFGAKLHTVYLGDNFDDVNDAAEGVPTGRTTYDPVQLESEKVYYWRIDEFDGFESHKGDIWAFTTPGAVGDPQPSNGAADVQMIATLSWTAADNAASHGLYVGTDVNAVKNATTDSPEYVGPRALGAESYDPSGLAWDSTYAWRVDEVYPAGTVRGLVWTFTTADFILVDDFESYDDIDPLPGEPGINRIFDKWIDGFGTTTNGALVGNDLPPYAEQSIVHGGAQSMPYFYDNNLKTSEATLTLVYPRDWTEEGVTKLSLWFRGDAANAADRIFVALNGTSAVYHDDASATQMTGWNQWIVDLQAFAGVDLTNVNTITIGIGTKDAPAAGGAGTVYFDDIRLIR
jgi:hypothetical protein